MAPKSDKPSLCIRIYAFLTGGKPVWLKDSLGYIRCSIAKFDGFGNLYAYMNWKTKDRSVKCYLLDNGVVSEDNQPSTVTHVVRWKWVE